MRIQELMRIFVRDWPKKCAKRAWQHPESTDFIAASKMTKVEKVTKC